MHEAFTKHLTDYLVWLHNQIDPAVRASSKRWYDGARKIAEKWAITREDMERFALQSHQRAARAWDEGRFDREVVPLKGVTRDEGIRPDTSLEKMAALKL